MSLVRLRERQHGPQGETRHDDGPRNAARPGAEGRLAELAEARACLRDAYARFSEGFAFPAVRDAAALLGDAADSLPRGVP